VILTQIEPDTAGAL